MDELKVTDPAAIRRASKLISLPVEQNGERIVVRIGAVRLAVIIEAMEGIPGVPAAGSEPEAGGGWDSQAAGAIKALERLKRLARLFVMEPAFDWDGPADGLAPWDALLPDNQGAIVRAGLDFSGWGMKGGAAEDAAPFREGAGQ